MVEKMIRVRGAAEHNLKHVDLDLPREKFIVFTGVSGSGKSSLAFDTLYAEGQRRYVESLSTYARQFLEQWGKPNVESIEGLPPTIAIEQRRGVATPRSTVATQTEIYDYLRILFAKVGIPYCPQCGRPIKRQSVDEIKAHLFSFPAQTRIVLLAPLIQAQKGEHRDVFEHLKRQGFLHVKVDGALVDLKHVPLLHKNKKHSIDVLVDRLVLEDGVRARLAEAIELGLKLGKGVLKVEFQKDTFSPPHPIPLPPRGEGSSKVASQKDTISVDRQPAAGNGFQEQLYSQQYACPVCHISIQDVTPRLFSFNSPHGACPTCSGLGTKMEIDPDLLVPNPDLSMEEGAFDFLGKIGKYYSLEYGRFLRQLCRTYSIPRHLPFKKISEKQRKLLFYGEGGSSSSAWEGLIPSLLNNFYRTSSEYFKEKLLHFMSEMPCPACEGARLKKEVLSIKIGNENISQVTQRPIQEALAWVSGLNLDPEQTIIARGILREIINRLTFLLNVGLDYLTLDRRTGSLSGGEFQRIRLATQVGSGLVGVCYVLDEPTIGLHPRDTTRLINTLYQLKDLGNTVLVIEHDEEVIRRSEYMVDMGPQAGVQGGRVVAQGTLEDVAAHPDSLTGAYLRLERQIPLPAQRRPLPRQTAWLVVYGAREHNLKAITARFPLGLFLCVTGVSGSGKSTLVNDVLYKALSRRLHKSKAKPGAHDRIVGADALDKVIVIDQSPIGRTPRSNPATYVGVFDEIRSFFAQLKEARMRGYRPGRFSFNVPGGRCEACQGQGTKLIEMHFLPDVYVPCDVCKGKRYQEETLQVEFRGKNIAQVLDMTVEESLTLFWNFPKIRRTLETLAGVGLGYIALGQASTTLSGGEAQRIKLAAELGRPDTGHTLYLLDEPSTGLHFDDIHNLVRVLQQLVEKGNTVLVIEHNVHIIKVADYLLDLGPEGGERGGELIAEGTPEELVERFQKRSHTAQALAPFLTAPPYERTQK